jgi:hypothetical protein
LRLLLGLDLAVVLDADVLVGGQGVDLVVGERGTTIVSLDSTESIRFRVDIRETLDKLELVLDLAALVGDLLLGAVPC